MLISSTQHWQLNENTGSRKTGSLNAKCHRTQFVKKWNVFLVNWTDGTWGSPKFAQWTMVGSPQVTSRSSELGTRQRWGSRRCRSTNTRAEVRRTFCTPHERRPLDAAAEEETARKRTSTTQGSFSAKSSFQNHFFLHSNFSCKSSAEQWKTELCLKKFSNAFYLRTCLRQIANKHDGLL